MRFLKIFMAALVLFSLQLATAPGAEAATTMATVSNAATTIAPQKHHYPKRHHYRHRPHRHHKK